MRNAFVQELADLAQDRRVMAILADNGLQVFDEYRRLYPSQFLNVGIAEANMIGVSAGLASMGYIPFAYTILPFLTYRAYEFVRDDVFYQKQNVKLVGIGAGFAYSTLGPTHHGTEDIGMIRSLPESIILSPADAIETKKATRAAYEHLGPVYLRIGKGKDPIVYESNDVPFILGKGVILNDGDDVTVIGTGSILAEALAAAKDLAKKGIKVRVVNIHTLQPMDDEIVRKCAKETGRVLTVEDHNINGGLGSIVAEILAESNLNNIHFRRVGLRNTFCHGYGSVSELRAKYGLDARGISHSILELLKK